MYTYLKKFSLSLIVLNIFMVQSLMADMMFYYSAAILPSIISKTSISDERPTAGGYDALRTNVYAGERVRAEVLMSDDVGIVHCQWEDEAGNVLIESTLNPPRQQTGGGVCDIDFVFNEAGTFHYTLTVTDTIGQTGTNELNVIVLPNDIPQVDIINVSQDVVLGTTLDFNATIIDDGTTTFWWDISTVADGLIRREDMPFFPMTHTFDRVGLHTIELVVWDEHGVQATDSIEINVIPDGELPVLTLIGESSVDIFQGSAYVELGATASDNIDGDLTSNIVVDSSSVKIATVGSYSVVYTVTDSSGNSISVTRIVNVILAPDTTPPVITLNGNASVELMQNETYTEMGANAVDDRDGVLTVSITGTVNTNTPGIYTVTYAARDNALNEASKTRTVTVIAPDAIPVITLLGDNPQHIDVGTTYSDAGVTVNDAEDGTLTASVDTSKLNMSVIGTQYVYYTATDSTHNVAEANRTVIVEDNTAPYLALNGSQVIYLFVGDTYADEGANCTDNYDATCGVWIETSNVDTTTSGTYTVVYAGEDSSLNQAQHITRTVVVRVELLTTDDDVYPTDIGIETVNVLANDQYEGDVTVEFFLGFDPDTFAELYAASLSIPEGIWNIVDNNVTFTPNASFEGGIVSIQYAINRTVGKESTITLHYSDQMIARHDSFNFDDIVEVMVDPINNDAIPSDSTVNMDLVPYYDQNGPVYANIVSRAEGNWSVNGTQIAFSPSDTFAGGEVGIEYHIYDQNGNESNAYISITFPVLLHAEFDYNSSTDISEMVTINLLANDTIAEGSIITTALMDYDENYNPIWVNSVVVDGGEWSLSDGTVTFTPDATFAGRWVYMTYKISDENGYSSEASIQIEYPTYIYAGYFNVDAVSVDPVTVDVLRTPTMIKAGSTVTVWFKSTDIDGNEILLPELNRYEGTWSNQEGNVTFTPSDTFNGSGAYVEYILEDQNGHQSSNAIYIHFPVVIQAQYDYFDLKEITPFTVDVLANDTNTSAVTIKLQDYDNNYNQIWVENVSVSSGDWSVIDGKVFFAPNPGFTGGNVYIQYQIEDTVGNIATSGITISYPIILQANYDRNVSESIQTVVVPVTDNDVIVNGLSEVSLITYDINGVMQPFSELIYATGTWSVEGESISFNPADGFLGGTVYASYRLRDVDGKTASSGIEITFPVAPSPVCIATTLNSVENVYATIASEIDFRTKPAEWSSNGLRHYTADLDTEKFVIDTSVYETITGSIPDSLFYDLDVEEYIGDEVFLNNGRASFDSNSMQWTYHEEEIGNDNGRKYLVFSDETGSYVQNGNELILDMDTGLKFVRDIDANEMEIILNDGNVTIALDAGDTAKLLLQKAVKDTYEWSGNIINTKTPSAYASLIEYVESYEYNNSFVGYVNGVLSSQNGGRTIVFASDTSGNSGTLVEVRDNTNEVLLTDAGTWAIKSIADNGVTYDALFVETSLCGYQSSIFKLDQNGQVVQGGFRENSDEVSAEIIYSESLYSKLKQYFIDHAIFDISAPYPPAITEDKILGKTFYTVTDNEDTITYESSTFISDNSMEHKSFTVDAEGVVSPAVVHIFSYYLEQGMIVLEFPIYGKIRLINEDLTEWDMEFSNGGSANAFTWLLSKPDAFPQ